MTPPDTAIASEPGCSDQGWFTVRSIRVTMLLVCLSALLPTGLSAAGSELYADNCAGCHGDAGEGNADLLAPVLAGQDGTYLARQIENFRSGLRRVPETNDSALGMIDILTTMADADIAEVSQYLSGLPLPGLEQETPPPGFRGRGLYSGCLSCHGARAEGNPNLNAPRLSGQYFTSPLRSSASARVCAEPIPKTSPGVK